jgi:hypothetical protein
MKHYMMLSDLYGRIGQMLNEHGDAPIGKVRTPVKFQDERLTTDKWVEPMYCTFTPILTDIGGVKIKTYELNIIDEG